jgi:hypothetical protein
VREIESVLCTFREGQLPTGTIRLRGAAAATLLILSGLRGYSKKEAKLSLAA